ncbi:prepilin-type N-terminal cleavage/methylation domain-containing protein [Granulicatella sp. zg-ZJ]|uniref:competence type IV pilus major pilin ComGC n=1 Tax=Granulicatella sp. zg-ZJ TaxID=2678504 RepID=UPI0013D64A29|nr:competence type IV pilus major pilin ComGC [Granulicatella sp. zg-ZJ]MBS4750538.1 prepilin-type N-terminal cleavage/methylation domain-containing protein [Carnobacteriaceae bacterium zg-ZUI78]NEW63401.1 prepilin-type N-terminal cleavage/methylation domain-containing protein [Granulicatella sp. zg-ZJ]
MFKSLKNKKAFTLLEMIIVLFIISILMLLIVPNLTDKKERIDKQGTQALANVVQTQAALYLLEHQDHSVSLEALLDEGYLNDKQINEINQRHITLSGDGHVSYPTE